MTSGPSKPDQTSALRANVMKRRRFGAITSVGVVLLALSGTVVGINYSSHQAELTATAGGKTERGAVEPPEEPETVPTSPTPSPIANVPSPITDIPEEPRIGTSPSPQAGMRAGRPGVEDPGAESQPPGPSAGPGMPGGVGSGEVGSGPDLGNPALPAEIVLGQTVDEVGDLHALVLNVADSAAGALLHTSNVFAVVSGSSRFTVTGDVAVGSWRFTVDSAVPGPGAPIVVIKDATGASVQDLAAVPVMYTAAAELNEDTVGTSTRLTALIAEVISKAEPTQPDHSFYTVLAEQLVDPSWKGVMIFNASATVPVEVLRQPTGALANSQVGVLHMGFEAPAVTSVPGPSSVFGTIDLAQDSGDVLPSGVRYVRARFLNSALAVFEQG